MTDQVNFHVRRANMDSTFLDFRRSVERLENVRSIDAIYDAICTIHDVASGLASQPRFFNAERYEATAAGAVLDYLLDFFALQIDDLADAMRETRPSTKDDRETRVAMLIHHDIRGGVNAAHIVALAQQMEIDQ